ncbi:MAG: TonB-dependent receptor [Paludibacteraceae bacterium]|nr:TonB-dependent receptor [Bacteroidales bacterium]MDY4149300.1 TonB-dependent receptor [Paludibacteraceae bacterium]
MKKIFLALVGVFLSSLLWADISGVVRDEQGEPLIGVSVLIEGTTQGTITDFDGNFTLNAQEGQTLEVSYMGYRTEHVRVSGSSLAVVLREDTKTLDEVVVVGYGTQKRSDLTGSVASVKADDVNAVPTSSVAEMLRGQAAGVVVTQNSARPGGQSDIVIRGKKSLTGGNAPLYIVDGTPVDNIDDFNSQDIESVEVLKDAAAQAIYGARASNGVILVTTKKGAEGKTSVDINAYAGAQMVKRNFDLYSGAEWAQLKREANRSFVYDPATKTATGTYQDDASLFGNMYQNFVDQQYTDWENLMVHPALQQKYDISVRTGNDRSKMSAALGYFDQEGMISPANYQRYNARFDFSQKLGKRVTLGFKTNYIHSNQKSEDSDFAKVLTESPLLSAYDADGNMLSLLADSKWSPLWNNAHYTSDKKTDRFMLGANLNWDIWGGFTYRLNASVNYRNQEQGTYQDSKHEKGSSVGGQAAITNTRYVDYLLENIFGYDHTWQDKHHLNVTLVQSIESIRTTKTQTSGSGFATDDLGYNNISAASITNPTVRTITPRHLVSFMGRVNYSLMDKYLFSVSARVDGSSVFGKNSKWGVFPAGSFAWRINQEDWLVDVNWLTNLKLRLSAGSVGNQAIDPYQTQGLVDGYYMKFGDQNAMVGYLPSTQLQNPDLKWETTTSYNVGIDFGFLRDRIMGSVEYYYAKTTDLLVEKSINQTTGYNTQLVNMGSVMNQGVEITANFVPVKIKNFTWTIDLIWAHNQNKILSLNGATGADGQLLNDEANNWFIGHNINAYYDYVFDGIWQLDDDIPDYGGTYQPQPGDIRVRDVNGDGQITPDDRVVIDRDPKWTASLGTSFKFYGVDITFDFYGVYGAVRQNNYLYAANQGGDLKGVRNGIKVDYWTIENPSNTAPRPRDGNISYFSSLSYQDASYFRLRNLSVGYSFPKKLIAKAKMTNLRIYCTASNLFTCTRYQSYSPEASAGSYPEPRTVIGGLNLSF